VSSPFTDADLEAYLDESLDSGRATEIEVAIKSDSDLLQRLSGINNRRNAGVHTLGEIWRRNQIGVPTAEVMGNYLLEVLDDQQAAYIKFRMEELKCPFTVALYDDLVAKQSESEELSSARRKKIYDTSSRFLKRSND